MKLSNASVHRRNGSRLAAVIVMLLLWVGMFALEVSPELHHFFHQDAQSPSHHCLVTQLQHHFLLPGLVAAVVPAPPVAWGVLASPGEFQFLAFSDYRLSPSRAPPAA